MARTEIFCSEVRFYGKHGLYLEDLTPSNEKVRNENLPVLKRKKLLFDTVVDIYTVAPLVGYLYQRKAPKDGSNETNSIWGETLINHQAELFFSYELLMVLDEQDEPDLDTRTRMAFRATDDLVNRGIEIYDNYARGGIEVLHENLIEKAADVDDLIEITWGFVCDFEDKFVAEPEEFDLEGYLNR